MEKILLIAAALAAAVPAWADWTVVSEEEKSTLFIDRTTLRMKGNIRRVWLMTDFRVPQRFGKEVFLSSKSLEDHDCDEDKTQLIQMSFFSANKGFGRVVFNTTFRVPEWEYNTPGSIGKSASDYICSMPTNGH